MDITPEEVATGTVVEWNDDDGWGFIRSADVPGDVFAHYSSIVGIEGFRSLTVGQCVRFTWEQYPQDGFRFRATRVFVGDQLPGTEFSAVDSHSDAYVSHLRIRPDAQSK